MGKKDHDCCCVCLTEARVRTRSRHVSSQVALLLGLGQHHMHATQGEKGF